MAARGAWEIAGFTRTYRLNRLGDRIRTARSRFARPGTRALRKLVELDRPSLTRSEAERRMLRLIRAAGLPQPAVSPRLGS